jgi:predicted metal-dependent hydrolase
VQLRKGRAGRVRLAVSQGTLVVSTGTGRLDEAQAFIREKEAWILKHIQQQQRGNQHVGHLLGNLESECLLFGKRLPVEYRVGSVRRVGIVGERLVVQAPADQQAQLAQLVKAALRSMAKQYLTQRTLRWAETCGLHINQVRVKDIRSRWGSCSTQRNINLNWHLVMVDKTLSDYVIVHELMHLHEMNHSPRFWAHVARWLPHYASLRQQLQAQQWIIGALDADTETA